MSSNYDKLIKFSVTISLIMLLILIYFQKPSSVIEYIETIGSAVGYLAIPTLVYERWGWKINPFDDTPKLKKSYQGFVRFNRDNNWQEKEIKVKISQTFTRTMIKIKTDEIISKSLISDIIFENGGYVLYYTYTTNPKSEYSNDNPIQIGSTKILIEDDKYLHGTYWTNRQTIGDIYFREKTRK